MWFERYENWSWSVLRASFYIGIGTLELFISLWPLWLFLILVIVIFKGG